MRTKDEDKKKMQEVAEQAGRLFKESPDCTAAFITVIHNDSAVSLFATDMESPNRDRNYADVLRAAYATISDIGARCGLKFSDNAIENIRMRIINKDRTETEVYDASQKKPVDKNLS